MKWDKSATRKLLASALSMVLMSGGLAHANKTRSIQVSALGNLNLPCASVYAASERFPFTTQITPAASQNFVLDTSHSQIPENIPSISPVLAIPGLASTRSEPTLYSSQAGPGGAAGSPESRLPSTLMEDTAQWDVTPPKQRAGDTFLASAFPEKIRGPMIAQHRAAEATWTALRSDLGSPDTARAIGIRVFENGPPIRINLEAIHPEARKGILLWRELKAHAPQYQGRILRRGFDGTLKEMIGELEVLLTDKHLHQADYAREKNFISQALAWTHQLSAREELSNLEILAMGYLYSFAASWRFGRWSRPSRFPELHLEEMFPFFTKMVADYVVDRALPIVTFAKLGFRSFVETGDYPVFPVQLLKQQVIFSEGDHISASEHFLHDLQHMSFEAEDNPFLHRNRKTAESDAELEDRAQEQLRRYQDLRDRAKQEDPLLAKIVLRILFYYKHETLPYRLDFAMVRARLDLAKEQVTLYGFLRQPSMLGHGLPAGSVTARIFERAVQLLQSP